MKVQTASRRIQNAKSAVYHKNVNKRGDASIQTSLKEVRAALGDHRVIPGLASPHQQAVI